jgi:DNA-binding transcriptional LysR family regulator
MKIEDLEIFLSVASCKSFSITADNLFLSQSSVSKSIKRVEEELNCKLFVRKHTTIELTPSGEALLKSGTGLVDKYHEMISTVQGSTHIEPVELIETIPPMKFNIAELFEKFKSIHPEVNLNIKHVDVLEDVVNSTGAYPPIILSYRSQPFKDYYHFTSLYHDRFVAVIPVDSTLAGNEISIFDLVNIPIYVTSICMRQEIVDYCANFDVVLDFRNLSEGPRREIALRNVENGYGVYISYISDLQVFHINSARICSIREFSKVSLSIGVKKQHAITNYEQMLISMLLSYSKNVHYSAGF